MNKEIVSHIKKEAQNLFEKLEVVEDIQVEFVEHQEEGDLTPTVTVGVRVEDPKMLIGERGQTLFDIQHVLKLILRKKITEPFYLSLDINEYKKSKEEYLQDLAQSTADEVTLLKKEKELPPMAAAERRVVHMALAKRSDIISESVGQGSDRRIVVKVKN
jgi:spoIIIJ-associated protein